MKMTDMTDLFIVRREGKYDSALQLFDSHTADTCGLV